MLILINIYKEPKDLIVDCIQSIKRIYPQVKIVGVYDGVIRPELNELFDYNFEEKNSKLYKNKGGGYWTHRYLKIYLRLRIAEPLIKIDPDTKFLRPIHQTFPTDGIFGTTWKLFGNIDLIHGGCIGYTNSAAKLLVQSNILLEDNYKTERFTYPRFTNYRKSYDSDDVETDLLTCQDKILFSSALRLKIPLHHFDEFSSWGLKNKHNVDYSKAVIHPAVY